MKMRLSQFLSMTFLFSLNVCVAQFEKIIDAPSTDSLEYLSALHHAHLFQEENDYDYIDYYYIDRDAENFHKKVGSYKYIFSGIIRIHGTFTKETDTFFVDGRLVVFYNLFPHVYMNRRCLGEDSGVPKDGKPHAGGPGSGWCGVTWAMHSNGRMKQACILNDSLGTLKRYWYANGAIEKEGHFWDNAPNGLWEFWNEKGSLIKKEYWEKGVLLKTEEFPVEEKE